MPFTTDARDVENEDILWKLNPEGERVHSDEYESIAFIGILLGIPHINASTYQEWYRRYLEWNLVYDGPQPEGGLLTLETVREFVGFKSNINALNREEWAQFIATKLRERVNKDIIMEAMKSGIPLHNTEYEVGQMLYLGWDQFGEVERPYKVGRVVSVQGDTYTVTDGTRYEACNLLSKADVDDIG